MGQEREARGYLSMNVRGMQNCALPARDELDFHWKLQRSEYLATRYPMHRMRQQMKQLREDADWLEGVLDKREREEAALTAEYGRAA